MAALSVMIVEDEEGISEVLRSVFELEGETVITARNGEEALELCAKLTPDVILLDMMMPVMDGFEFLKKFLPAHPRIPVIAMSALASYLKAAKEKGAVAAIQKPMSLELLLETTRKVVLEHRIPELPKPREISVSEDERRIDYILRMKLDEPAPEKVLHEFVSYVAGIFQVPVALISIVTESRQYWTAMCGLPSELAAARGTERADSFCTHIVGARAALVVQDALENPVFQNNLLVQKYGLRFYAGVPLITRFGDPVGTLCINDFKPRRFSHLDLQILGVLAKRILAELDWREKNTMPGSPEFSFKHLSYVDADSGLVGRAGFEDVLSLELLRFAEQRRRLSLLVAVVRKDALDRIFEKARTSFQGVWIGRIGYSRFGFLIPDRGLADAKAWLERSLDMEAEIEGVETGHYFSMPNRCLRDAEISFGNRGLSASA
ncbi:MAG: response regulator [Oligoflexia bacterium]|nr:response regulator [Oligoflexia bacterium]